MKYPIVLFFRYKKYLDIDKFIFKNKTKFNFTIEPTCSLFDLNKIYNPNYNFIITFGLNKDEYKDIINDFIPKRFYNNYLHYSNIEDINNINDVINIKYIDFCIENRINTRPLFSIFTTCYNSYEIINRPFSTILNQSLIDWEWVIIDDSPDEKHFEYLKTLLKDNRIRLYKRDKNSGSIGNVKNEAISLCRGKYILELDHDDEIVPNLLENSLYEFEKDEEVGFIYWDFVNKYDNGSNFSYGDFFALGYGGYYTQKLDNKWVNVCVTPNINNITMSYLVSMPNHPRIWRRTLLNQLNDYSEYLPICDDFEILLKTALNTKIIKICDVGYIQYMSNQSFSSIRNSEINRIGPNYLSPIFYEKYDVHNKMKELNAFEDKKYCKDFSQIWKRDNYIHKYLNKRIHPVYNKICCIIGSHNINYINKINNNKCDIIVLDNKLPIEDLQCLLNDYKNVKCYSLLGHSNNDLINYFNLIYRYTNNYEIINYSNNEIIQNPCLNNDKIINSNLFTNTTIKYENKNIIIIDNFYNDIDDVRFFALYNKYNINGNFPGLRTKSYANDEIKALFEKYIGKKITYWPASYNGSYQYTTKNMNSWVHRDETNWAGVIYLTPNAPLNSGTGFYRHKKTGIENKEEFDNLSEELKKEVNNDSEDMSKWELIDMVGNKYNRLVLFQGTRNHRSMEYFGNDINDGRLFQTWFFNTEN